MKYALGPISGPATPRSSASFAHRSASITMPAEFGLSHTSSLSSTLSGTSPKAWPSSRICAHLRSSSHGTWSLGPMWMFCLSSFLRICDWTDWVFETFLDVRRSRSSMFMKSMLPPKFSW